MRTSASPEVGRRALALVAANQHGVFTRAQARAVNCSDSVLHRLVASGEVERVHPRVYRFAAAPSSLAQRAKAATLYAGERAWVSHRTAAFKLGMIDRSHGTIELISERDLRGGTDLKVRLGRVPRSHTIVRDGIPMTNSIRTMVDLASVLADERLEFVLDHCLYEGLVEVGRLMQCAESLGVAGRRRTRVLKDLLCVRGEGLAVPLTVLERQFLKVVRSGGLDEPEKQVTVESDSSKTWRLDFVYPQHKVLIEVDGRRWHAGRQQARSDRHRDNVMNVRGWVVLRFTWEDVMNDPAYVIDQVRRALGIALPA
jgi:very-short-patch-repair endonuclease